MLIEVKPALGRAANIETDEVAKSRFSSRRSTYAPNPSRSIWRGSSVGSFQKHRWRIEVFVPGSIRVRSYGSRNNLTAVLFGFLMDSKMQHRRTKS